MRRVEGAIADVWHRAARFRAIMPIMASVCVIGTGNALLTTTVSLYLSDPSLNPHVIQLLLTAFPIGFMAGCLTARGLVSRLGHERAFLSVALLAAFATCGYMVTMEVPLWFCLRLINGFAMATLFIVAESWTNLYADQRNRGIYFSLYMLMTSLAVLFGQLFIEAAGPHSPYLFLIALVVILVGLFYSRFIGGRWPDLPVRLPVEAMSATAAPHRYGLWQLVRLAPVTVVSVFQAGMTNMNVYTMTPIYGERVGLAATSAVTLVTAFSIGGMLAQAPAGWLSDRMDRRLMLLLQGLATTCLCAAIAWPGLRSEAVLYALFFAYGAIALTIYPVGIAYANSQLDSRHMVSASGSLLLLYSIGNIMTPGLAAGLMEQFAPQALFILLGSGAFLVAIAAGLNLLRRPSAGAAPCIVSGGTE